MSNDFVNKDVNETLNQDISALFDGELDELGCARVLSEHDNPAVRNKLQRYSVVQSLLHSEDIVLSALSCDVSLRVKSIIDKHIQPLDLEQTHQNVNVAETVVPAQLNNPRKKTTSVQWFKPAIGFAMAASMAFVTVFSIDYWRTMGNSVALQAPAAREGLVVAGRDQDNNSLREKTRAFDGGGIVATPVSLTEQELNDPYQVVVAADQELRKREQLLLQAHEENTQMQQHLREYLIRHAQQNVSSPVNGMLPIARVSHNEYE